jgi:hypothetical protein
MQCNNIACNIIHLSKFPLYELGNYNMVFEVGLELTIDEEDGATVVQKMSELVNKAKELGFVIVEAEAEQEEEDNEEESDKYEKKEE